MKKSGDQWQKLLSRSQQERSAREERTVEAVPSEHWIARASEGLITKDLIGNQQTFPGAPCKMGSMLDTSTRLFSQGTNLLIHRKIAEAKTEPKRSQVLRQADRNSPPHKALTRMPWAEWCGRPDKIVPSSRGGAQGAADLSVLEHRVAF